MFYKGTLIQADKLPGFIKVPASFNLDQLTEFLKNSENMHAAQKFAKSYLKDKEQLDLALSHLERILPGVTLANPREHLANQSQLIPKISSAIIKLCSHLSQHAEDREVFSFLNLISSTKQIIFNSKCHAISNYSWTY